MHCALAEQYSEMDHEIMKGEKREGGQMIVHKQEPCRYICFAA
jgi:hypothetical protein